jgi:tetratricopeptide (TPR) repeat protein
MKHRAANSFKRPDDHGFPVNPALSNITLKCLEPAPEDRYQDTAELLDDLQKTCPSMADGQARQKFLAGFFTKSSLYQQIVSTKIPAKQADGGIDIAKKLLSMRPIIIIPVILLAILLASYTIALIMPPKPKTVKPESQAARFLSVDNAARPTSPQENGADEMNGPTSAAAPTLSPVSTSDPIPAATVEPIAAPEPPKPPATEADLLRDAAAAINKKEWDRAIRILEKNAAAFKEKKLTKTLLLLEAYIESRRLDKAQPLLDTAALTDDAFYFLNAGRYWFYKGNHTKSIEMLEASLTRSSVLRSRNVIFDDAMYYIAMVRSDRFKAAPTDANRLSALDGWRRVKSAYGPRAESPRFKRAEEEIAALN